MKLSNRVNDRILIIALAQIYQMKPKVDLQYVVRFPRSKTNIDLNALLCITPIQSPQRAMSTVFPARKMTTSQSLNRIKHQQFQLRKKDNKQKGQQLKKTLLNNIKNGMNNQEKVKKNPKITLGFPKSQTIKTRLRLPFSIHNYQQNSVRLEKFNQDIELPRSQSMPLSNKQNNKRQFLRKDSRINRQIVINLLKIKLSRQKNQQDHDIQQFQTQEIVKMIKVYKGGNEMFSNKSQHNKKENRNRLQAVHLLGKEITGWENEHIMQYD